MLKIKELNINNINNFKEISVQFNENFNIISGQNGSGKTTILNCILASFQRKRLSNLYVNALQNHGFWEMSYYKDYVYQSRVHYIENKDSQESRELIKGNKLINTNYIISISVNNRNMATQFYGENPLKRWLFENQNQSIINYSVENNFLLAKECFSMIDENVQYDEVVVLGERHRKNSNYQDNNFRNLEVALFVRTNKGKIKIEQMSSGYQSVLMILLNLIRKIEKLSRSGVNVYNFEGVLLIDEIDLYLHPEWQKKLIQIIRWLVPKAQIITTTHSPHIIQSALPGEIIPFGIDPSGDTYIRKLPDSNKFGYQGWTIEEILEDVMGLKETRSQEYKQLIRQFDIAIDNEKNKEAKVYFKQLEEMLHPKNHTLKLLKLQMASLGGINT